MISVNPVHVASLEALRAEAARFASTLTPHAEHATLITLSGDLGAGKTSFTQGIASALGVNEPITSPTFVLQKIYPLHAGAVSAATEIHAQGFSQLVHMDAYRLGDVSKESSALVPLGFAEAYANPPTLIVLEWPEIVASELPPADHQITLSVTADGRSIAYA